MLLIFHDHSNQQVPHVARKSLVKLIYQLGLWRNFMLVTYHFDTDTFGDT